MICSRAVMPLDQREILSRPTKIRDQLAQMGISVKDNKDGTTSWEPKL